MEVSFKLMWFGPFMWEIACKPKAECCLIKLNIFFVLPFFFALQTSATSKKVRWCSVRTIAAKKIVERFTRKTFLPWKIFSAYSFLYTKANVILIFCLFSIIWSLCSKSFSISLQFMFFILAKYCCLASQIVTTMKNNKVSLLPSSSQHGQMSSLVSMKSSIRKKKSFSKCHVLVRVKYMVGFSDAEVAPLTSITVRACPLQNCPRQAVLGLLVRQLPSILGQLRWVGIPLMPHARFVCCMSSLELTGYQPDVYLRGVGGSLTSRGRGHGAQQEKRTGVYMPPPEKVHSRC